MGDAGDAPAVFPLNGAIWHPHAHATPSHHLAVLRLFLSNEGKAGYDEPLAPTGGKKNIKYHEAGTAII